MNIAEGNGKRSPNSRNSFFEIARGSATECTACLDILCAKGVVDQARVGEGKHLLLRLVQMLTKLIMASIANGVREERAEYQIEALQDFEHEHEHEHD